MFTCTWMTKHAYVADRVSNIATRGIENAAHNISVGIVVGLPLRAQAMHVFGSHVVAAHAALKNREGGAIMNSVKEVMAKQHVAYVDGDKTHKNRVLIPNEQANHGRTINIHRAELSK